MPPIEIVALVALTGCALYRQTRAHEIGGLHAGHGGGQMVAFQAELVRRRARSLGAHIPSSAPAAVR